MVDWEKVEEGVALATALSESERNIFLSSFCSGNDGLRSEIESLLRIAEDAREFLEHSFGAHAVAVLEENHSGRIFGSYEIFREVGHGGMGAVYLARRIDGEFDQEVALKIVRGSIADSLTIERFRQERQILASLNHPNIARLLDGGISSSGEPYLAMEYVDGLPITQFVSQNKFSVNQILSLFAKVCSAVAYAHRSLIVHRDIKPGNILVTADGEPKLLDFGLAKLSVSDIDADKAETLFRALTPAYASPEQLLNRPITTASDTYSLGILLFELLTGKRPFNLENKTLDQVINAVTAIEPPMPSAVADRRIASELRGDLDTIIQTALRVEPEFRYQSVSDLSEDIGRYLDRIPVKARRQTMRYRTGKFVRRHRVGALAALLVLLALLAGTSISLWQARQARIEKTKAEAVSGFLQAMLSASSPTSSLKRENNDLTVKELLDEASSRLSTDAMSDQHAVKAKLQQIIGTSYLSIGQYDLADRNLTSAYEAQVGLYGEDADETLETLVLLASLWTGRGDYAKAIQFYEKRLVILREGYAAGRIRGEFLAQALSDLALLVRSRGDSPAAEPLLREAIELAEKSGDPNAGVLQGILALTLSDQGNFAEAEALIRENIEKIRKSNSSDAPELASSLTGLGSFQLEQGRFTDADEDLKTAEKIYRKRFAPTYMPLGDNLRLQAYSLLLQGSYRDAEDRIDSALSIYDQGAGKAYVNYASALMIKGSIYAKTGRLVEGEAFLRDAVRLREENLPAGHFLTALAKEALGDCLLSQNKTTEAEKLLADSFESLKASQGTKNPRTNRAAALLAQTYRNLGNDVMAARILNEQP